MESILYHQDFLYVPEIINFKLIYYYHNDPLAGHSRIEKAWKLIVRKYFWHIFYWDIKAYVKGCDICLTLKAVDYKSYGDLLSLLMPIHYSNDLSIDFVIGFLLLVDKKSNRNHAMLVVIDFLIKLVHYEPIKTTKNVTSLAKVLLDMIISYHSLLELVISNCSWLFIRRL